MQWQPQDPSQSKCLLRGIIYPEANAKSIEVTNLNAAGAASKLAVLSLSVFTICHYFTHGIHRLQCEATLKKGNQTQYTNWNEGTVLLLQGRHQAEENMAVETLSTYHHRKREFTGEPDRWDRSTCKELVGLWGILFAGILTFLLGV